MTLWLTHIQEVRTQIKNWQREGQKIGLVPTMGDLHEGHLSLVDAAQQHCDKVIATIFVNPTQFGPGEDFDRYTRQEQQDFDQLSQRKVDLLWTPLAAEIYPPDFQTKITLSQVTQGYCGAKRPGHFDGVAGIVSKFFNIITPDMAFFGEKDFQQLALIKQMCKDLNFDIEIGSVPTCREKDGLAMSSRNRYLSDAQRQIAPHLHATLTELAQEIAYNRSPVPHLLRDKQQKLLDAGFDQIDYLAYCDSHSLAPLSHYQENSRLLAAAFLGKTRLIDNIAVT